MGITSGNGGPFGIPEGQVTADNPDGVSITQSDGCVRNSLYDARFVSDGHSYGAFPMETDFGFTGPQDYGKGNGGVTEPYKK